MKLKSTFTLLVIFLLLNFSSTAQLNPQDVNGDGTLDILVIGTSQSIKSNHEAFAPNQVRSHLQNILSADTFISLNINVVAEDIYRSKTLSTGIAGAFVANRDYFCHSLLQYYYWPDGNETRMDNLQGNKGTDWDYVVIGADPYLISSIPGFYSLGVNKIASKVAAGGAIPLLLMVWPKDDTKIAHFEEFTYRTANGAKVSLENIPAGLAWQALPTNKKDLSTSHPTPNGAYLTAASIYSHLFNRSATASQYVYDDAIADVTYTSLVYEATQVHYTGTRTFESPYKSCGISDQTLIYNHGGTSTENGILNGLQWVVAQDQRVLQFGANAPVHFNYGRSSMGSTHLYVVDSSRFDFSFGYPLQDDRGTGLVTMRYGIDQRVNQNDVETDLGVALKMVRQSEIPYARNVPLRTLIAQMIEEIPDVSIYSDNWHISADVNKAIGSYMYTMLTGDCAMAGVQAPLDSTQWRTWMSHKIGYETAWNVMHMEGNTPCFGSPTNNIISNAKENALIVYPNPTSGLFTINLGKYYDKIKVAITDLRGKKIASKIYTNTQLVDCTLTGPAGIYFVVVEVDGVRQTIKLVKQ